MAKALLSTVSLHSMPFRLSAFHLALNLYWLIAFLYLEMKGLCMQSSLVTLFQQFVVK